MAIYRTNEIRIDLNELVSIRSSFLGEKLSEEDIENLGDKLKYSLTFDTVYGMVDQAILEYLDKADTHYGEIAGNEPAMSFEAEQKRQAKAKKEFEKNFDIVKLESSSWTIDVPMRKRK